MEEPTYNLEKVRYLHIVLEGSEYEAGKQVAEVVNQNPNAKHFFSSAKLDAKKAGAEGVVKLLLAKMRPTQNASTGGY